MSYPYEKSGQTGPEDQPQPGFAPVEYPPQSSYQQQPYPGQTGAPAPGFAQQPGYPMPAYPAGPMPAYPAGAGYAPYGVPVAPSGGTAITAGVLAIIVGVLSLIAGVFMLIASAVVTDRSEYRTSSSDSELFGVLIGIGILVLVVGVVWCVGATLLFMRKTAGRIMLIVMSSIAIVLGLISLVGRPGAGVIGLLMSILILVFAAVPPTGRWIEAGKQTPVPPQQAYYPYY
ncbi:hypothetical protein GPX89_21165 [Nocardia sp. ET3-3]|uniref:DUF4064 domain-containing protein n=1 Tax=Nocardia terrae TaxID=2675851 RepID=A0A7K1UZD4_9NOCA|nr:hypothetical protein [Nocardia terrae]MVU79740.1 hypothetical protein [Nocardia terrae]